MLPVQSFAAGVLASVIRNQPPSPARTALAWQLVVGPTLARVTSVEVDGTTLRVTSSDERWLREIDRAKTNILPKLQDLLGRQQLFRIITRT